MQNPHKSKMLVLDPSKPNRLFWPLCVVKLWFLKVSGDELMALHHRRGRRPCCHWHPSALFIPIFPALLSPAASYTPCLSTQEAKTVPKKIKKKKKVRKTVPSPSQKQNQHTFIYLFIYLLPGIKLAGVLGRGMPALAAGASARWLREGRGREAAWGRRCGEQDFPLLAAASRELSSQLQLESKPEGNWKGWVVCFFFHAVMPFLIRWNFLPFIFVSVAKELKLSD